MKFAEFLESKINWAGAGQPHYSGIDQRPHRSLNSQIAQAFLQIINFILQKLNPNKYDLSFREWISI